MADEDAMNAALRRSEKVRKEAAAGPPDHEPDEDEDWFHATRLPSLGRAAARYYSNYTVLRGEPTLLKAGVRRRRACSTASRLLRVRSDAISEHGHPFEGGNTSSHIRILLVPSSFVLSLSLSLILFSLTLRSVANNPLEHSVNEQLIGWEGVLPSRSH